MSAIKRQSVSLLVGDGTPYASEQLAGLLRAVGFKRIVVAASAPEFLEALHTSRFDLALLGEQLAGIEATAVTRAARQLEATTGRQTPVVLMVSDTSHRNIVAARESGAAAFVKKPVSATVLGTRLDAVLANPRTVIDS